MKTLFIFPSSLGGYGINESTEQPPLGIGYLASVLEREGFESEILDANFLNYDVEQTVSFVKSSKPDVVCLSLYAFNFRGGISLAEAIKKNMPNIVVIAGGAHPSALGEKTMVYAQHIDAVVIGEGEMTLLNIIKRLNGRLDPFLDVAGVIYRKGDIIIRNNQRDLINDLDFLPFPSYHLYPNLSRYRRRIARSPAAPLLTSRGCPFGCIYCAKSVFGRQVRYRSVENVIEEIDYLVDRFKVRQLDVVDDNFITDKKRAIKILQSICEKPYRLSINLQSGVSATLVDKDILKLMKEAGVYRIAFGVESGNQDVLNQIKKRQRLSDIMYSVNLAKKMGIRTDAFFMLGLPGESPKTMQDTINFAKKLNPLTANFHMVVPFPGTELYDLVRRKGRFLTATDKGIVTGYNYPRAFYEIEDLKKEDIERYYKKAYKEFYLRPKKIMETLLSIKSLEEFIWLVKTGVLVIMSILTERRFRKR